MSDFDEYFGDYVPDMPGKNDLINDNLDTYAVAPESADLRDKLRANSRDEAQLPFTGWPDEGGQSLFNIDKLLKVLMFLDETGHDEVYVRVEDNHPILMQARKSEPDDGNDSSVTFAMVAPRFSHSGFSDVGTDEWFDDDDVTFKRWTKWVETEESETCDVVKQDGEVCGRDRPCQYHDKRGDK